MSIDILGYLEEICHEKELDKNILVEAIENAICQSIKKHLKTDENFRVKMDTKNGKFDIYSIKKVVGFVKNPLTEISYKKALDYKKLVEIGEEIKVEQDIKDFGRIAAKSARLIINQKVNEAQNEMVYNFFEDKVSTIITGKVMKFNEKGAYVDLVKGIGFLPYQNMCPRDNFRSKDRIKLLLKEMKINYKNSKLRNVEIILSRQDPLFTIKLFEEEVPELSEGIINILKVVRDPQGKIKMSVASKDTNIDPVASCVGLKGARVQAIVKELKCENIDIIPYSENIEEFVSKALSPAKIISAKAYPLKRTVEVIIPNDQLSLAIGKKGQNVKLAVKLTEWKIDLKSESDYLEMKKIEFKEELNNFQKELDILREQGYDSFEKIMNSDLEIVTNETKINLEKLENLKTLLESRI